METNSKNVITALIFLSALHNTLLSCFIVYRDMFIFISSFLWFNGQIYAPCFEGTALFAWKV